jgi:hypothetical protein
MEKPDRSRTASPGGSATRECCPEPTCESGCKNNYFEGKRLTPDMFRVEQNYHVGRRHLLNRAIHGTGVVYGYALAIETGHAPQSAASRTLQVGPGLALDPCGRELVQAGSVPLGLESVIVLDAGGHRADKDRAFALGERNARKDGEGCWLLSVHYAELDSGQVRVPDPCECDAREWDRVCEAVRYSLRPISCKECCADEPCGLECGCCADGCRESERPSGDPERRGSSRCICDHLTDLPLPDDCCDPLCPIDEPCGRVRVDLAHGVSLACVGVVRDDCGDWTFADEVEACGPRRFVKRNDLLFELIRGCDLTRIVQFGWADWHRCDKEMPFDEFYGAMGAAGEPIEVIGAKADPESEYVTECFWVEFSRPVRKSTLLPDCVVFTIVGLDRENWRQVLRVPVTRIDTDCVPPKADDPADHARSARVVVDGKWVNDALHDPDDRTNLFFHPTTVEIEFRGDFIEDCNGQTVDINAHGRSTSMTGNGTPGGTFLSTFRVAPRAPNRPSRPEQVNKGASS